MEQLNHSRSAKAGAQAAASSEEQGDELRAGVRLDGSEIQECGQKVDAGLRKRVVDSLIAAVELANLEAVPDTALIHSLLTSWFKDFFSGNTVDLDMMHRLLCGEEGITRKDVARICIIYSMARSFHGFEVKLPRIVKKRHDLATLVIASGEILYDGERYQRLFHEVSARQVPADPLELDQAPKPAPRPKPREAKQEALAARAELFDPKKRARTQRAWTPRQAALLGGCALISIVFSVCLSSLLGERKADYFDVKATLSVLSLRDGLAQDTVLYAVIDDPRWPEFSREARQRVLVQVFELLAPRGIQRIVFSDAQVLGVAAVSRAPGSPGEPEVILQDQGPQAPSVATNGT